jgi:hypothetical protein
VHKAWERGLAAPLPSHMLHAPGNHTGRIATVLSFTIAHPQRPKQLKSHRTAERHSSSRSFPELRSGKEPIRKRALFLCRTHARFQEADHGHEMLRLGEDFARCRYTKVGRIVLAGFVDCQLERHVGHPSGLCEASSVDTPSSFGLDSVRQHDYISIGFRAYVLNPS